MVHKDILIEELVAIIPESVSYLMRRGIKCIACGEPIWGTLADAAKEKGFSETEIENVVRELKELEKKNHED
jgi:methionine synthase II (cobalamin-independent)